MSALFLSLISNPTVIAIVAAIVAIIGAFFKGHASGAKKERAKEDAARLKARQAADKVNNDVGALPADDAKKELGKWSK